MKFLFFILLFLPGCYYYSGGERYSELPEHYVIAAKLWQATYDPASKDTLLKPVYGWKYLDTDSALVVKDKIFVPITGIYKIRIECRWQNANPALRIVSELANWNGFVKFQIHEEGETVFEQNLNLQEPMYELKLGVTDGFTPETENPSLLKTRQ